jgi:hypothetical protein
LIDLFGEKIGEEIARMLYSKQWQHREEGLGRCDLCLRVCISVRRVEIHFCCMRDCACFLCVSLSMCLCLFVLFYTLFISHLLVSWSLLLYSLFFLITDAVFHSFSTLVPYLDTVAFSGFWSWLLLL